MELPGAVLLAGAKSLVRLQHFAVKLWVVNKLTRQNLAVIFAGTLLQAVPSPWPDLDF